MIIIRIIAIAITNIIVIIIITIITEAWRSQGAGVGVYTEHLARLKRIVKEGGGGGIFWVPPVFH